MANLVGTSIARNYVKADATTQMGTRELAFFQVEISGASTNYQDSDSTYSKAIRGLQTVVELYGVGRPSGNQFVVIASADTAPFDSGESNGDGNRNAKIEAAVNAATGGSSTVWNALLNGWNLENDC